MLQWNNMKYVIKLSVFRKFGNNCNSCLCIRIKYYRLHRSCKFRQYINITCFTWWHGRLSPQGNIVDRGGAEIDNAFSRNGDIPWHPIKNVIYISLYRMPHFLHNLNITLLHVSYFTHRSTFSLNVARYYGVAKNTATAISFSIWTVRAYSSRIRLF